MSKKKVKPSEESYGRPSCEVVEPYNAAKPAQDRALAAAQEIIGLEERMFDGHSLPPSALIAIIRRHALLARFPPVRRHVPDIESLAPFLHHNNGCSAWPYGGPWRKSEDSELCDCGLAKALRAVRRKP